MLVAAGFQRSATVVFLIVSCDCDDPCRPGLRILPQSARHLASMQSGQSQVEQHDLGTKALSYLERGVSVDGESDFVAHVPKHISRGMQDLQIVVDYENADGGGSSGQGTLLVDISSALFAIEQYSVPVPSDTAHNALF
jgi:hypothetical protein